MSYSELLSTRSKLEFALEEQERINTTLENLATSHWSRKAKEKKNPNLLLPFFRHRRMGKESSMTLREQCVKESQSLHDWKCKHFKSTVMDIKDTSLVQMEIKTAMTHRLCPSVLLCFRFVSRSPFFPQASGADEIGDLEIACKEQQPLQGSSHEDILLLNSEIQTLLDHCEKYVDFLAAFSGLANYFEQSKKRMDCLNQDFNGLERKEAENGISISVKGAQGNILCVMLWALKFDHTNLTFNEEYSVEFSPEAVSLSRDCGFPPELVENGSVDDWNGKYCLQNLTRMAGLDHSFHTPVKRARK